MQITKEILFQDRNLRNLNKLIEIALNEDLHGGDETSKNIFYFENSIRKLDNTKTHFISKADGVISGLVIIPLILKIAKDQSYIKNELEFVPLIEDGFYVKKGKVIAQLKGNFVDILSLERILLNFLSRMSGVATLTDKFVQILKKHKSKAKIYDTRKTIPGFRLLDKYSVNIGGGTNHRLDLSDYLIIKDNYLEQDLYVVLKYLKNLPIKSYNRKIVEVEIDDFKYFDYEEIWNADIIMLDNMNLENLKKAISLIREKQKKYDKIYEIEISGGFSINILDELKNLDVDRISFGKITHSVPNFDISLGVK
ncbi:MAG: carboxylating nicotinate-nucleotide diphosphorylase [Elusimicrobiota bacterium]|jgi:nicotinate-nucleotide pyrophosphorylase (carboxylating)|nr:carboxylating nicotinate-nucleotide diphosphorylase [Elusimicrobiota bacterium]